MAEVENIQNCFLFDRCNHCDCNSSFCIRKSKMEMLYDNALISNKLRRHQVISLDKDSIYDLKDVDSFKKLQSISNNIESFVENGTNLYLHSAISGNGKTSWSLRLVESYFNKIWPKTDVKCRALFVSVPKYLLDLKREMSNPGNQDLAFINENIYEADLVIFDDIAAKMGSEFDIDILLGIIDTRVSLGKSNIYTSNLNKDEMSKALGTRLASRVCNMSVDIELFGTDKRTWAVPKEV